MAKTSDTKPREFLLEAVSVAPTETVFDVVLELTDLRGPKLLLHMPIQQAKKLAEITSDAVLKSGAR